MPIDPLTPGIVPPWNPTGSADPDEARKAKSHVLQGSSAAGARALGTQLVAFYFRAPVKAFFKMRVDYMQVARAINPHITANAGWSFAQTTPGLLAHAIREHGWGFIPRQVLPPMIANATVGAILYTTYLQSLAALHEPNAHSTKRVFPPPPISATFLAGFMAGTVQSIVAAPLDALVVRFKVSDMLQGGYKSVFHYSRHKLKEIGVRGVFAGYGLSFLKESFGYGLFFASFEFVKQQAYFSFLTWWYSGLHFINLGPALPPPTPVSVESASAPTVIRPHYSAEPIFLLLAGAFASITQQAVQHPISKIQDVHYGRLESIDYLSKLEHKQTSVWQEYRHSYGKTYEQCQMQAKKAGGWRRWLWRGLAMHTLRQIPSTSAGLFVFELFRRRFATEEQEKVVIKAAGREILLN
ncbi:mitochondrial carrier domain-containing protein [Sphaerosporella brunnea]|uniref:Mitochondrial carrier domain-containing protein n=1 Tax=Sphaerosporella brunnea TaxID=1250544 RepID=A0A5J5F807_9PEZI|nr:mitochondrial carrier domain-containing protein [Sphaerosporella brunnea]KAA8913234.1 mitochondrial carrier domain-containing protein [Sphaerosporella brunnea]